MSEINSVLVNIEATKISNDTANFSKKNAWKNEWEKAQLDNRNNAKRSSTSIRNSPDNSDRESERSAAEIRDLAENSYSVYFSETEKKLVAGENISLTTNSSSSFPDNSGNAGLFLSPSATSDIQNFSNISSSISPSISSSKLPTDNLQYATQKTEYTQNIIEQVEIKFSSILKPQNLNLLTTENGVRMLLRDYRLDKSQLDTIVDDITGYLKELGIHVTELIVNGTKNNDFNKHNNGSNNNNNNNNKAINTTGETS